MVCEQALAEWDDSQLLAGASATIVILLGLFDTSEADAADVQLPAARPVHHSVCW